MSLGFDIIKDTHLLLFFFDKTHIILSRKTFDTIFFIMLFCEIIFKKTLHSIWVGSPMPLSVGIRTS